MKRYVSLFLITLILSFFLTSFCNAQQKSSGEKPSVVKADSTHIMALGKVIFANTCKACHGNPAFPRRHRLRR